MPSPSWWRLERQAVRFARDFAVDRVHRSLQPALMLLKAFLNEVNSRFHFVYGFPNGKAEAVLKRAQCALESGAISIPIV